MTIKIRDQTLRNTLLIYRKKMGLKNREAVIDKLLRESLLPKPKPLRETVRKIYKKGKNE